MQMLKKVVAWFVIGALAVTVLYLLAERNHRQFSIEQQGQALRVMRGRRLPAGVEPYLPGDKLLAEAYAPLPLGAGDSPGELLLSRFGDRDELDRALFKTLRTWIEVRIESDDPNRLAQAMVLLRRAELLNGIDDEQRRQLRGLQGRIAWFEGKASLDDAVAALREAVTKLRLAAEGQSRFAAGAGELYERIRGLADELARAARLPLNSAAAPEDPRGDTPSNAPSAAGGHREGDGGAPAADDGGGEADGGASGNPVEPSAAPE